MKRKDAVLVTKLPRYRILMPFLLGTRNESVVYYDTYVRADKLEQYLQSKHDLDPKITVTHAILKACSIGLHQHSAMNRYISGHRLYQRTKATISFSLKKEMKSRAPIKVVKSDFPLEETIEKMAERINAQMQVQRSNKKTYVDKEIDIITMLPRFVLRFMVKLIKWLDYYNLLPASFIKNDPLYASLFIANLGSFGMDAGFHHLYEYGNISIFGMVGKIREMPVVEDGQIVVRKILHIRWSYDERIDDGFTAGKGIDTVVKVLEDPFTHFSPSAKDEQVHSES